MIKKVLIANRGEIALRIIRACAEMNIATVAVYSNVDRDSLHVKLANEAYCIGTAQANQSYLDIKRIIAVAEYAQVDAIHPGYGFLAESIEFARACENSGITFIGPSSDAIQKMGNKIIAKETMSEAGVPVVPGYEGVISSAEEAHATVAEIGYPVLIKAVSGGGGKGMRIVHHERDLEKSIRQASNEALQSFGDASIYIEKYIPTARHIEVQIIADQHGNVVHLGERDCSAQRRYQKVFEEAPSPFVTPQLRQEMGDAAVKAARASDYVGVGTVEFIVSDDDASFYFMEMNTRIQVEHPVSEMVTGIDIVKNQIKIAQGDYLPWSQNDIHIEGWSLECRINAEDPEREFMPIPGQIRRYKPPFGEGIRVDSAMSTGAEISPFYDSMIAKLIVWAPTREAAIDKMQAALADFEIVGIPTTIPLHQALLAHPIVREGEVTTKFLEENLDALLDTQSEAVNE